MEKIAKSLPDVLCGLFLLSLLLSGVVLLGRFIIPFFDWLHPYPEKILSRMERKDPQAAQEIIDSYAQELEAIAAAAEFLETDEGYWYALNWTNEYSGADNYREQLQEMPKELADALRQMEERVPECEKLLELHKGQIGVLLTDDGGGFSFLCYPGGTLIYGSMIEDERGVRCLDMGSGWELQMYYAPKG